ncbi:uncharacterized protein LOC121330629 [Polyodon spathula]|uniref:uncharacterized protein LOC121330629 n=1 Tax=Polyodon spathula TaxID=7913 RepID=UPI001B7DBC17|nr:uncharacterized protein LOC121330629 [Polyodon spathula]
MRLEQTVNGLDLKDSSGGDEGNNKKNPGLISSDNEEYGFCNRKCVSVKYGPQPPNSTRPGLDTVYEMREWDSVAQDSEDFKQKEAKMVDPCSFRYNEDPMAPFCLLEREESYVTNDNMFKLELMSSDDSEDECSSSFTHTVIKIAEAAIENRSPLPEVLPEVVPFKDSSNIDGNEEGGKVFSNPSTVEVNERACKYINGKQKESNLFHGLELQEKKRLNINTNATVTEESSVKLLSNSEGLKREHADFSEQQKETKEKGIEADLSPLDEDIEECESWAMDLSEMFKGSSNEECNKQEALQKNTVKTWQKSNAAEEKLLFDPLDKTSDSYIVHQNKDSEERVTHHLPLLPKCPDTHSRPITLSETVPIEKSTRKMEREEAEIEEPSCFCIFGMFLPKPNNKGNKEVKESRESRMKKKNNFFRRISVLIRRNCAV